MGTCKHECKDNEVNETDEKQKEEELKVFWDVESDEEVVKHLNLNFPR
jgi:hypothetical protein